MDNLADSLREARVRRGEEHVRFENTHDLDAVMGTFSGEPYYDERSHGASTT